MHFWDLEFEVLSSGKPLRTRVYVDGYNLYYGRLKRTPYKWLDLRQLFAQILAGVLHRRADGTPAVFEPAACFVKFFTAPILPNFAGADDSVACQQSYHRALHVDGRGAVEIVTGYFDARRARAHRYLKQTKPRDSERVEIWRLEEKQSDVALAVHALADALEGEVDHLVFVSNDTDLVPVLEMIRMKTATVVGLVVPTRPGGRQPNASLSRHAHWTRKQIADEELASAQLDTPVMEGQKPIHKPLSWHERPDLLEPIFTEAKRVRRSAGAAWRWLHTPNGHLGGRAPLSLCTDEAGAQQLRDYMAQYAREFNV